jgi:hypothetical protein
MLKAWNAQHFWGISRNSDQALTVFARCKFQTLPCQAGTQTKVI